MSNKLKHDMVNNFIRIELLFNKIMDSFDKDVSQISRNDIQFLETFLDQMSNDLQSLKAIAENGNRG